jgi:DNA invertase Pin-like site-specific DNA recombinase
MMETKEIRDVALYARVSKNNSHQDPEAQLQPMRADCARRGWRIVAEYVDHGWSGAKERRPNLDELMLDVVKGRRDFQAVMVWKFDRFARSVQHLLKTLEAFNSNGVAFVSLTEAVDTSTPMGKFMLTMLGALAEMELSLIRERIKNGLRKQGAGKPGPKIGENGPSRTTLWRRQQRAATAVK